MFDVALAGKAIDLGAKSTHVASFSWPGRHLRALMLGHASKNLWGLLELFPSMRFIWLVAGVYFFYISMGLAQEFCFRQKGFTFSWFLTSMGAY